MNQLLYIINSTHIKGVKNTQWAFLKICFSRKKYCCRHKTFPGLPWALLEICCMDNTHSNLWLSLGDIHPVSSWQAGFPVQPHRIYWLIVVEKNWRLVSNHIWVWKNQDELEGEKKKKVVIITSQLTINHYKDKRKGAACRNLQEIQVFSDFLSPPLCISRAEERGP